MNEQDTLSLIGQRKTRYLAPLGVLHPGFKAGHLQVDGSTAALNAQCHVTHDIMTYKKQNKDGLICFVTVVCVRPVKVSVHVPVMLPGHPPR